MKLRVKQDSPYDSSYQMAEYGNDGLFYHGPVVMFQWTNAESLSVQYVSPNIRQFGYCAEEFIAATHSFSSFIYAEDRAQVIQKMKTCSAFQPFGNSCAHPICEQEYRVVHANGTIRWVYSYAQAVCDNQGGITHFTGYILDITERKGMEKEIERLSAELKQHVDTQMENLRRNQELLQRVIDNSPSVIFVRDKDGKILLANKQMESLFSTRRGTLFGKTVFDLFPKETANAMWELQQRVMSHGKTVRTEECIAQHGEMYTYFSVIFPIFGEKRTIYAVGCISTDITDRKQAERALRQAEQERADLQQQIIDTQQHTIRELSTPLLPLTKGVIAMPLLGTIDAIRVHRIMETLLTGVSSTQAHTVIIDITGVQMVDAQVADGLLRTAQAIRLLGAKVILTGIRPDIAQTFVLLGADFRWIITRSSFQDGIREAVRELKIVHM